jgi:hypothetical protein
MLQHNVQNEWKNHTTTEELKVTGTEPKREIGSGLAKGENSNCAKKLTGESKLSLSAPFFCADSIWNYSKAGSKECAEFNYMLVICKSRGKCREEN